MENKPRVAFVVQRCGEDIAGGAEALCLSSARTMLEDWECEILTTCARDARTWENDYGPGPTTIGEIHTIRFPVDRPRDPHAFERASVRIKSDSGSIADQEAWMREQGPFSSRLLAHLEEHGRSYDCVFFFSYLYATTYFGLPLVADRAVLVPLAHDEWTLRLPLFDRTFALCAHAGFLSEEERLLVELRFPRAAFSGSTIRLAIEPGAAEPQLFRDAYGLHEPFALSLGRVEPAKGTDELIDYFIALRAAGGKPSKLVLAGPIAMPISKHGDIRALGRISESDKWNALAAAEFVVVSSPYESLSIVALEAWAAQRAILANGTSAVLVGQCRRANGGLWYANRNEFIELAGSALYGQAAELGMQGARYVAETFTQSAARFSLLRALDAARASRR
jgi:glycosyltransferase involved in cell wall biosynthesis